MYFATRVEQLGHSLNSVAPFLTSGLTLTLFLTLTLILTLTVTLTLTLIVIDARRRALSSLVSSHRAEILKHIYIVRNLSNVIYRLTCVRKLH